MKRDFPRCRPERGTGNLSPNITLWQNLRSQPQEISPPGRPYILPQGKAGVTISPQGACFPGTRKAPSGTGAIEVEAYMLLFVSLQMWCSAGQMLAMMCVTTYGCAKSLKDETCTTFKVCTSSLFRATLALLALGLAART